MSEKKTETVKKTTAAKKPAAKKAAAPKAAAAKAAVKSAVKAAASKAAEKKPAAKKAAKTVEYIIQSPMGGEITPAEILKKIGKADKIYVRVDENKAYWVRGKETGSVDLWD